jgi:hypothetical protein
LFDCAQPAAVKPFSKNTPFPALFSTILAKTPSSSIFAFKNALLETHLLRETLLFHSFFAFFNVFLQRNNNALSTPSFSLHAPRAQSDSFSFFSFQIRLSQDHQLSAHLQLPPKLHHEQPITETTTDNRLSLGRTNESSEQAAWR